MTEHTETDCRSDEGITVGLIDGIIATARILRKTYKESPSTVAALEDLRDDEDMAWLMGTLNDEVIDSDDSCRKWCGYGY